MSDATDDDLNRTMLSRQTVGLYERAGSDARIDDDMVRAEIDILEAMIEKYPGKSATLGALIDRWVKLLGPLLH